MMIPNPVTEVSYYRAEEQSQDPSKDVCYIQQDGVSLGSLGNLSCLANQMTNPGIYTYKIPIAKPTQLFEPLWSASPEPQSSALVGSFFIWDEPSYTEPQNLSWQLAQPNFKTTRAYLTITTCSVSSYWNTAQSSIAFTHDTLGQPQVGDVSKLEWRDRRNITLDVANVKGLSDARLAGNTGTLLAIHLSAMFTVALSQVPVLPERIDSYRYNYAEGEVPPRTSRVEVKFTLYGYGYSTRMTAVRLALAVILLYCVIVATYLIYILVSGETSTAWNSAIEMVSLALRSRKADCPDQGHNAVGMDSLNSFQQSIGIRINGENEVELVFASDRSLVSEGLRKVQRNTPY